MPNNSAITSTSLLDRALDTARAAETPLQRMHGLKRVLNQTREADKQLELTAELLQVIEDVDDPPRRVVDDVKRVRMRAALNLVDRLDGEEKAAMAKVAQAAIDDHPSEDERVKLYIELAQKLEEL